MEGKNKNYISLQEATKFCSYSQKYLNLRVRQNKLKAIKLGRNWVTTREWIDEYVKIYNGNGHEVKKVEKKESPNKIFLVKKQLKPVFASMLFFVVIIFESIFAQGPVSMVFSDLKQVANKTISIASSFSEQNLTENIFKIFPETKNSVVGFYGDFLQQFSNSISQTSVALINQQDVIQKKNNQKSFNYFSEVKETVSEYFLWMQKGSVNLASNIVLPTIEKDYLLGTSSSFLVKAKITTDYFFNKVKNFAVSFYNIFDSGKKFFAEIFDNNTEKILVRNEKIFNQQEGIVVAPSTTENEKTIDKIKKSFSDEVAVQMKDSNTGIIKPIFKTDTSQEYLYLLVPIQETN